MQLLVVCYTHACMYTCRYIQTHALTHACTHTRSLARCLSQSLSISQSLNLSISQSLNLSISQSLNLSISQSLNLSLCHMHTSIIKDYMVSTVFIVCMDVKITSLSFLNNKKTFQQFIILQILQYNQMLIYCLYSTIRC